MVRVGVSHEKGGRMSVIKRMSVEEYLKSVLPAEMSPGFPMEALKAQAVAARSYTYKNMGRHSDSGFDFCDTTHCQVYLGEKKRSKSTSLAVEQTRGRVLTWQGEVVEAIYQSTCGGSSANNEDIFGGKPMPYLRSVKDNDFCRASPYYKKWTVSFSKEDLIKALSADPKSDPGRELYNIIVLETDLTGRPTKIKIMGEKMKYLSGYHFWLIVGRTLSWSIFKSTNYKVKKVGSNFVFSGFGNGHGVGMCQYGALGMAKRGYSYKQILSKYFLGAKVVRRE
ncbi:MAG: SpoIID/LytB domain-containing protein [Candidatus Saganbacteria bacterium]|nr:SpoIID/LytB domain-containing protein [Candidatus Saganbacteria bacterium]